MGNLVPRTKPVRAPMKAWGTGDFSSIVLLAREGYQRLVSMKRTARFAQGKRLGGCRPVRGVFAPGLAVSFAFALYALALGAGYGQAPGAVPASGDSLPVLTNILQVLQLGINEARQRPHRVDFEAVITEPTAAQATTLWVQDDTNAVLVLHTNRFD